MKNVALSDLPPETVKRLLSEGRLYLHLGPYVTALSTKDAGVREFLTDMYQDCSILVGEEALVDFSLEVRAPNLVRRYIRRQIVADPGFYFPAVPLPVKLGPLCLEMGMNLCVALQSFRQAIFHAGVVSDQKGGIVIAARSGGGKSTLTAALMEEGFRLLSDEFAILCAETSFLLAYPRPVSLKNQSIDVVRVFAGADQVSDRLTGTPKGDIAYRRLRKSDLETANLPAKAKLILFPRFQAEAAPAVEKMDIADAAMQLIASSPNYQVIGEPAFHALMQMLDGVEAYEITYGNTEDSLMLVKDLWEAVDG
ncbi:MAG: HprK-related kinase A [Alphaproteobacteria bacterium]|nr:HprK-related kinase A [Alphaproteobacteria bacterium]